MHIFHFLSIMCSFKQSQIFLVPFTTQTLTHIAYKVTQQGIQVTT